MYQNEEIIIGKIISERFSIEWMRYNMFISNNIYQSIPMLVFRLNDEKDMEEQIIKLKTCVESFEGKNLWTVFKDPLSRRGNYILTLKSIENIREECKKKGSIYNIKEYLGMEKFKLCCEEAIQDIPFLAEHIQNFL